MRWRETAGENLAEETPHDEQDTDNNVRTMEACDHEKRRSIDSAVIKPKPFVVQVHPLIDLNSDKRRTQNNREPEQGIPDLPFFTATSLK